MKLKRYLMDQVIPLVINAFVIILVISLLMLLRVPRDLILLTFFSMLLGQCLIMGYDFFRRRVFYKEVIDIFEDLDKKHYIAEMIKVPNFYEGQILEELMRRTTKSMKDEIANYKGEQESYKTYIETWIHEVKIPMAGISLMCDNNPSFEATRIKEEVDRIDTYVEQALYYAKSSHVASDYIIREVAIDQVIKEVIRKYSKQLINSGTQIEMEVPERIVKTDSKWFKFILGQIISNSIKYKKDQLTLSFSLEEKDNQATLSIKDNGIGIPSKDLPKVIEKGFTGENGRREGKSTGIGLFLCDRLCQKMYLGFSIDSVEGEGTSVFITFPELTLFDEMN